MAMVRRNPARQLVFEAGFALLLVLNAAKADTTAVTTTTGADFAGYVSGAGFSFTATTNLDVTQIGYLDFHAATAPTIRFWSGTNYVFATYVFPPGSSSGAMVYSNITLTLLAGQQYSVTVDDDAAPSIFCNGYGSFQVAPELSGFTAITGTTNSFSPVPGYYLQGPDFTYTVQSGAVVSPALTIVAGSATNVLVSWSAATPGFVLQQIDALDSTNWINNADTMTTFNGTNQVSDVVDGNRFFRLYHP